MKIITLNIAHRDSLGQDYDSRIKKIAQFLDDEQADIVCLQALAFTELESQADELNRLIKNPYSFVQSELIKRIKVASVVPEQRSTGMRELIDRDPEAYFSDGLAIMSNLLVDRTEVINLTKVMPGVNGRHDRHPRISQNVDFLSGIKISNIHLAANSNAYQQLDELICKNSDTRFIIGDINMSAEHMQEHKDIWEDQYISSTTRSGYISFPEDGVAYDHLLIPKESAYELVSIHTVDGLSDHFAVVFEIGAIN